MKMKSLRSNVINDLQDCPRHSSEDHDQNSLTVSAYPDSFWRSAILISSLSVVRMRFGATCRLYF
jgi:hypothetical protein